MKIHYSLWLLLISTTAFSQVGIGTTNPEATLHVAGETSTIRIEALNSQNDQLNDGMKLAPTYVDKNGELTLSSSNTGINSIHIIDASHALSNEVVAVNNYASTTLSNIYNYQIVLPSETFIEIKYSLSYSIFEKYDLVSQTGVRIFDGQARQVKTFFTIDSGIDRYGQISQNYYNISTGGGSGTFYNNGFAYISLPPGTYTLNFFVDIAGHVDNTTAVVLGGAESLLRIRFYQ